MLYLVYCGDKLKKLEKTLEKIKTISIRWDSGRKIPNSRVLRLMVCIL